MNDQVTLSADDYRELRQLATVRACQGRKAHREITRAWLARLDQRVSEGRQNVTLDEDDLFGQPAWRCAAGQTAKPVGCEYHREHHWCVTCKGFYGVPHDGVHEGVGKHPRGGIGDAQCACRPCKIASGREPASA